jgi:hypothetical protein
MRKILVLVLGLSLAGSVSSLGGEEHSVSRAGLTPVISPFTGPANPVRGLGGGGLPWKIASGRVELKANGRLEVEVRGLVLVNTGTNPIANFAAIVSCRSVDPAGAPTIVNQVAGMSPATSAGDAEIEGTVQLPSPCIAPIVFVAIPATATAPARWLAASGF